MLVPMSMESHASRSLHADPACGGELAQLAPDQLVGDAAWTVSSL